MMEVSNAIPTLEEWVSDTYQRIDKMFAYFMTSNPYAADIIGKQIYSLPDIVRRFESDEHRLKEEVETAINNQFGVVFDEVATEVSVTRSNDPSDGRYKLSIAIRVLQDGKRYELKQAAELSNGSISKIIDLSNR